MGLSGKEIVGDEMPLTTPCRFQMFLINVGLVLGDVFVENNIPFVFTFT